MAEKHQILGPGGKPLDPVLAARLAKNPHLLLGHLAGKGGSMRGTPKMQIDIAVSDESVKAMEVVIQGLRDDVKALKAEFNDLIERATKVRQELEAVKDAVHS